MDYAKSGNAKSRKGEPRFDVKNQRGGVKDADAKAAEKAALLARLKAAAEAKKPD